MYRRRHLGGMIQIVALDTNARGIERLEHMARRLGVSIVRAAVADATTWHPTDATFDRLASTTSPKALRM